MKMKYYYSCGYKYLGNKELRTNNLRLKSCIAKTQKHRLRT